MKKDLLILAVGLSAVAIYDNNKKTECLNDPTKCENVQKVGKSKKSKRHSQEVLTSNNSKSDLRITMVRK